MPTLTQEDYLRAIYRLSEDSDKPIKNSDLTEKLKLTKGTVSKRLKEMQQHGWVTQVSYGPIELTASGLKIARNLTYKHRLIELYLLQELNFEPAEVHAEAHLLEHAISDKLILKIAKKMRNPTHCPHGKKLPEFIPE